MLLNAVILTVRKLACKAKLYGDNTSYFFDIMDRLMNQVWIEISIQLSQ
jgi:hypothetical protein